jgi:hypothetical protein
VDIEVQPTVEMRQILAALGVTPGRNVTAADTVGQLPLLFTVLEIAKAGDADKLMPVVYLQQRIRSPKHCGLRRFVAL